MNDAIFMNERTYQTFNTHNRQFVFPLTALQWGQSLFEHAVLLNSNNYKHDKYGNIQGIIALGAADQIYANNNDPFEQLKTFSDGFNDWLFGFFGYELKNRLERLSSKNADHIKMPEMHFFRPVIVILQTFAGWQIGCLPGYGQLSDPGFVFRGICSHKDEKPSKDLMVKIKARVDKKRYLEQLQAIKKHIQQGDIYEMNYCVEFFADQAKVNPISVYDSLNRVSPTPFSAFYCLNDKYLMCASPERFLKKQGQKLISQPIKGTGARGKSPEEDERLKQGLFHDVKERSENVMIVDLVRNDLARTAEKGSVHVEELFGVYAFPQVHQMISTVVSKLDPKHHFVDAIKNAFPMGSMTGAPKIRAMELIDLYEDTRRGLYSGAVGYICPEKNFDFNVVIRSVQYNAKSRYLNYMVGGAITAASVPEKEYEECMLKAQAMERALDAVMHR